MDCVFLTKGEDSMIGVSACLGGLFCRYDGGANELADLKKLVEKGQAVPVCPECLGGLATPRTPAEIIGGDGFDVWQNNARVMTKTGRDVTVEFKTGSRLAFQRLQENDITTLVMKESSPSCGRNLIYDGSFSGIKKSGVGVAVAYFLNHGMTILSEKEWSGRL
jgi:uncharacterized protein YbbK (DUF523 family)